MANRKCPTCGHDMGPEAEVSAAVGLTPEEHETWKAEGSPADWKWWQQMKRKLARAQGTTVAVGGVASTGTAKGPGTQEQPA